MARKKTHGGLSNFGTHKAAPFKKGGGRQSVRKTGRGQTKTQGRQSK